MNHAQHYQQQGYVVLRDYFNEAQLRPLHQTIERLHDTWLKDNLHAYENGLINSAYLTRRHEKPSSLPEKGRKAEEDRDKLFQWIASESIVRHLRELFPSQFAFMNSQLFFDPCDKTQKNYWHRDPQYHLTLEEQKQAIESQNVIHCRIPFVDERGIEVIPGSQKNWDNDEELNVRLGINGRNNCDDLPAGASISLKRGDLLFFSANMIHRGLYGNNRLALDLLYCDRVPDLLAYVDPECLPTKETLAQLDNPQLFVTTQ